MARNDDVPCFTVIATVSNVEGGEERGLVLPGQEKAYISCAVPD